MVVKQIGKRPGTKWKGDEPSEVEVMRRISDWERDERSEHETGCVNYLRYVRYPRREVHRIYMVCYCSPSKSSRFLIVTRNTAPTATSLCLLTSIARKGTLSEINSWAMPGLTYHLRRFLPELFIWDVFYHLAYACRTLQAIPSFSGSDSRGRRELVHLDIKPGNGQSLCSQAITRGFETIKLTSSSFPRGQAGLGRELHSNLRSC